MELDDLRKKLDQIDSEIVRLLDERFAVTDGVARFKDAHDIPLTDRPRELALIAALKEKSRHPAVKEHIDTIYNAIITANKLMRGLRRGQTMPFKQIGIIGIGTIGGAIIKALKTKNPDISIHALKRSGTADAVRQHYIDHEYDNAADMTAVCDLIIIASPIDTVIPYAREFVSPGRRVVVMDVASVKSEIAGEFERLTKPDIEFVPTHPMAGSEKQGFTESRATLFVGRPWAITPHSATSDQATASITSFIEYLGSIPRIVSPADHDRQVAIISHLIFLMSAYLYSFANEDKAALLLAGSGFESTTRLASGNVSMHEQIVAHNRVAIQAALQGFLHYIADHPLTDPELFSHAKSVRDEFYNAL